jgi:ribosomal protein L29
MKKLCDTLEEC